MPLITWDESYSVGVSIIDKQHQKLVGMMNGFQDAIHEKRSREALAPLFDSLIRYTECHFEMEETYFDQFKYEHVLEHKKEHALLIDKVLDIQKRLNEEDGFVFSVEVMIFLKEWIVDHMMGSDKKYTACFNQNGLR